MSEPHSIEAAALSISDDDLCAGCKHLDYHPGEKSRCRKLLPGNLWPARFNADDYAAECPEFEGEGVGKRL